MNHAARMRLWILAAAALMPVAVSAQTPPANFDALIAGLADADAKARLAATTELRESGDVSLADLEAVLRTKELSTEQRRRLLGLAFDRFQGSPRAAMGVTGDIESIRNGAVILNTFPGFPAARVIKSGDRVIHAAGMQVDSWDTLRRIIVSRNPGDDIPITVVREGTTLNLRVKLGEWSGLRERNPIEGGLLVDAWRIRSRDLRGAERAPIDCGMGPGDWPVDAYMPADAAGTEPVALVIGGEPRGGLMLEPNPLVRRNVQVFPDDLPRMRQPLNQAQMIEMQIQTLRSIQRGFFEAVSQNDEQIASGRLTEDQKAQLLRHNQELNRQARAVEENVILLERQLGRRRVRE